MIKNSRNHTLASIGKITAAPHNFPAWHIQKFFERIMHFEPVNAEKWQEIETLVLNAQTGSGEDVFLEIGKSLLDIGHMELAIKPLCRQLSPASNGMPSACAMTLLATLRTYDHLKPTIDRTIDISPYITMEIYGFIVKELDLPPEGILAVCDLVLNFCPDDHIAAYNDAADALIKLEEYEAAYKYLKKAMEIEPEHPVMHVTAAEIAMATGDTEKAKSFLDFAENILDEYDGDDEALIDFRDDLLSEIELYRCDLKNDMGPESPSPS